MANVVETANRIVPSSDGARDLNSVLSPRINAWLFPCLLVGGLLAIGDRYVADPDTLSYLSIAGEALKGNVGDLVNGLRSLLYPALIALMLVIAYGSKEVVISELHSLAVAGYPFDAFYAHALDARITVQLSDTSTFENIDSINPVANCHSDERRSLQDTLKSAHIKAVVGRDTPEGLPTRECTDLE